LHRLSGALGVKQLGVSLRFRKTRPSGSAPARHSSCRAADGEFEHVLATCVGSGGHDRDERASGALLNFIRFSSSARRADIIAAGIAFE
jgi:hypothetical protein